MVKMYNDEIEELYSSLGRGVGVIK
jgi:hypothetical protein